MMVMFNPRRSRACDWPIGRSRCSNEGGVVLAYEDYCTHTGGPLTQGSCEGGVVTCLWHGAQFRISDGAPLTPPAGGRLRGYAVRVARGVIEIEIED